jgi:hypothetical protein
MFPRVLPHAGEAAKGPGTDKDGIFLDEEVGGSWLPASVFFTTHC